MDTRMVRRSWQTRIGLVNMTATERGILSVGLKQSKKKIETLKSARGNRKARSHLSLGKKYLNAYLRGETPRIDRIRLDDSGYSQFEKRVLMTLRRVAYGTTKTYQGLAKLAGNPKASRAVGTVMRKNRTPIFNPCHRIIQKSGKIGNYSGGAGLKKLFLELESEKKSRGKGK